MNFCSVENTAVGTRKEENKVIWKTSLFTTLINGWVWETHRWKRSKFIIQWRHLMQWRGLHFLNVKYPKHVPTQLKNLHCVYYRKKWITWSVQMIVYFFFLLYSSAFCFPELPWVSVISSLVNVYSDTPDLMCVSVIYLEFHPHSKIT